MPVLPLKRRKPALFRATKRKRRGSGCDEGGGICVNCRVRVCRAIVQSCCGPPQCSHSPPPRRGGGCSPVCVRCAAKGAPTPGFPARAQWAWRLSQVSPSFSPHPKKKGEKNKLDALPLDARISIGVVLSVLILIFGYFGLRYNLFARFRGLQPNPYHPANTAPSQHAARGF